MGIQGCADSFENETQEGAIVSLGIWCLASYFLGSIPTSHLVSKLVTGVDLRELGSRNLGATNVYRVLGWGFAIPVGVFDVVKGYVPVAMFAPRVGPDPWIAVVLGVAAVVGHVFSVFVRFRGGKGVATATGAVLALAPAALAVSLLVWILTLAITGFVSLGSILGALAFPIAAWFLAPGEPYVLGVGVILAAFIVFNHRHNIRRLAAGTENRFGSRRREA